MIVDPINFLRMNRMSSLDYSETSCFIQHLKPKMAVGHLNEIHHYDKLINKKMVLQENYESKIMNETLEKELMSKVKT